jgi:methylmalonyl-CoA mutase N-terminal domain/subunit
MRERFGVTRERALAMRFHAQTGGSTLTAQQPENNVARVALQALAAVLGGAQSLHTNGMDEALSLPTEKAATIALRTQQILAHESGVADTVDPLGGAYALEALTDALEAKAREYLAAIERLGGTVAAIESGFQQREIQEAAYRAQQEMERGERVVVGVNRFAEGPDRSSGPDGGAAGRGPEGGAAERGPAGRAASAAPSIPIQRLDPGLETAQRERVQALRAKRDAGAAAAALAAVEAAARGGANVMPAILHAVEQRATLGEIADRMRAAFGAYRARDRI